MTDDRKFTPEEMRAAVAFVEANPSAGPPPPEQLQRALRPLIADRRWMSDDAAEVVDWLAERFQDVDEFDHRLRALLFIVTALVERMAEATPGVLEPVKLKKLLRDPVTGRVEAVAEGTVARF